MCVCVCPWQLGFLHRSPPTGTDEGSDPRKQAALPEDTAREEDLILHLVGGAAGDLHAVFVLLLHLVSHVVLLGDVTAIVDLEAEHRVSRGAL